MAIRTIIFEDDDRLRKKARVVEDVLNPRVQQTIEDLVDTLYDHGGGIGLAANQIGILRRIFVVDLGDEDGLRVFVNPEILEQSGEQSMKEGCLSIPGVRGEVKRPAKIKVKAQNEKGEFFVLEAEDLLAVCICHEMDHLDGVLFTDKVVGSLEEYVEEFDEEEEE